MAAARKRSQRVIQGRASSTKSSAIEPVHPFGQRRQPRPALGQAVRGQGQNAGAHHGGEPARGEGARNIGKAWIRHGAASLILAFANFTKPGRRLQASLPRHAAPASAIYWIKIQQTGDTPCLPGAVAHGHALPARRRHRRHRAGVRLHQRLSRCRQHRRHRHRLACHDAGPGGGHRRRLRIPRPLAGRHRGCQHYRQIRHARWCRAPFSPSPSCSAA